MSWRASDRTLWWTDVLQSRLHRLDWPSMEVQTIDLPERLGSFGFVDDDQRLICAFETGFAFFRPASGETEWISRPLLGQSGVRLNDGRVDRQGRFWAGSMVEDRASAASDDAGVLYRVDRDRNVTEMVHGLHISNGLAWSPDGRIMYLADTPIREIRQYAFDPASGSISDRRRYCRFERGDYPDGATVDADGNLWSAMWGAGRIDQLDQSGRRVSSITVPASQPTCTSFGGDDLTTLFVTSARTELPASRLREEPLAGSLFVFENAGKGIREPCYKA